MIKNDELLTMLARHVTAARFRRIVEVSSLRTRYLAMVAEDLYYSQNASALLRSCDCFGIQDVHIIENRNRLPTINRHVALGTSRWLTIRRYRDRADNTRTALSALKRGGYRIVATVPDTDACSIHDFSLDAGPAALVFGNERDGISPEVRELADEFLTIPMCGFAESLNISVSAAIILSTLGDRLRRGQISWQLPEEDLAELRLKWVRRSAKRGTEIEEEYFRRFHRSIDLVESDVTEKDIPVGDQE